MTNREQKTRYVEAIAEDKAARLQDRRTVENRGNAVVRRRLRRQAKEEQTATTRREDEQAAEPGDLPQPADWVPGVGRTFDDLNNVNHRGKSELHAAGPGWAPRTQSLPRSRERRTFSARGNNRVPNSEQGSSLYASTTSRDILQHDIHETGERRPRITTGMRIENMD